MANADTTREIDTLRGEPIYILRFPRGCVTYRPSNGYGNIDTHLHADEERTCDTCDGSGLDLPEGDDCWRCEGTGKLKAKRCNWLGDAYAECDGTSLGPYVTNEDDIWQLLESWRPTL